MVTWLAVGCLSRLKAFVAPGVADGDWVNDKRHGWGKMTFVRGLTYEGEWNNDKTEGFGVCVYENGDQYSGDWLQDHRCGRATNGVN